SSKTWQTIGPRTNACGVATITGLTSNAFFRVAGAPPQYAGAQACVECHQGTHDSFEGTAHASAFTNAAFAASGGQTNNSCIVCHTVGYGLPNGFVNIKDKNTFPRLAGVQCESCHGPAGNHAANPDDFTARPRIELAAQVCGGCHTGTHQPTFDEWKTSGHYQVVEDMSPASRVDSCGRCHSGSARLTLLKGGDALTVTNDANVGLVCVTCHNPHQVTANPFQLRNPLSSTNYYSISTSGAFTNQYDPNINLCAQCHNHRGATWTTTSRPPHHSPQYNILLGSVGELSTGTATYQPAAHGTELPNQCVDCHMQTAPAAGSKPAVTGHSFEVTSYATCAQCHPYPELLATFTTSVVGSQIQEIKNDLDFWATTKAPAALQSKYGAMAWEYTTPGELSTGPAGPNTAEQAQIPDNIKKARYNLYLVLHDGSYGVHNGPFVSTLLDNARNWVVMEINK
ncbi:MAG TPA: cytochrome c family protein, partial [Verrucomicrobiae bacterium]